ncbi:unnamed protein product [Heligmosomoides polygyrus]|uniref:Phlebovirus_G2 domain-containing protein n=1 Tax=Heligmosomoides polygyrus TaxID=6339 RepID=A0A183FX45_HELPZ|nr:unnamed protein product [Heligmosomoides polygyrus]
MAKSRLDPLNQSITIPRLELSALAIGAKLITYITQQLPVPVANKFLWIDSSVVALAWSKGDKQVPIFVRNRVKTIQEHTSGVNIRYLPTDDNPADIGTRELQFPSSKHYLNGVENLSLSFKDYLNEYDFTFFDRKGWRRPHDSITGTSRFCKKHQCKARATLFCTYDNPLTLLFINDTESSASIPIQAWGTISKAFYGFPRKPRAAGGHIDSDRSIVKTTCSTGGISLQSDNSLDVAEVCINNYCIFLKNVTSETLLFPNSLVMYDYEVWKNGNISNDDKLACKDQPICELLQCHVCWEQLYKRKCWTYSDMIILVSFIAAIVIILPTAYIVVKIILTTLSFITTVFGNLNPTRCLQSKKKRPTLPTY